jgi:hypothetical protein
MGGSVASSTESRPRTIRDVSPRMAKAALTDRENRGAVLLGHAIQRALSLLGWTVDRCALECKRDRAQVSRWISGTERPQIDTLLLIEEFRQPFAVAIAEVAGCDVRTVIEVRRRA